MVGVSGPFNGAQTVSVTDYKHGDLIAKRRGVQLRVSNVHFDKDFPYYAMPPEFLGNQLKSYGGSFRYNVEFIAEGYLLNIPDIILIVSRIYNRTTLNLRLTTNFLLQGNGVILTHSSSNIFESGIHKEVSTYFTANNWYNINGQQASRQELMMALVNVENILIRMQYTNHTQLEVELLNILMDSSATQNRGLGSAVLVEECRCPIGYSGLSCESCDIGYVRENIGVWLGTCRKEIKECRVGQYGDPASGIPCRDCPCPLVGGQNFARTCSLSTDGNVQCHCKTGYSGRRCEECASGYAGNPTAVRGSCQLIISHSNCDERGTEREINGECVCKEHVTGERCNQCKPNTFNLDSGSDTGCVDCFCMGVTQQCSSSSYYRDTIFAQPKPHEFGVIYNYENPSDANFDIRSNSREVTIDIPSGDTNTYYWSLPTPFKGGKVESYGGYLNYTVRYLPSPSGGLSQNLSPDVVIRSKNDVTLLHFHTSESQPSTSQSYSVRITEKSWRWLDGNHVQRAQFLMALADVDAIFIKATYTTTTVLTALSEVSLDTATSRYTGSSVRATEVEQCVCLPGHTGLSCEECTPGYSREQDGGDGAYLGLCQLCQCNGHSEECHPKTGICRVS